ncbi:MAG: hypothetical protein HEQ21_07650 [Blastomonas sp.]|uniref:hypothetical protein n=1 Tax=Blastomonas sp. TaxID=1909299 RepID=UPI0025881772|nr:hypothetical protein [Blastomonas sp.]MCO5792678.1 hypothetical protein [Blastomonas sp.]
MSSGRWLNAAEISLDRVAYPVGYQHHLEWISTNPNEVTIFFRYRAVQSKKDPEGIAWEWGEDFALQINTTGAMVIVGPDKKFGKLYPAKCVDCGGEKLLIELNGSLTEDFIIEPINLKKSRRWTPKGYANVT